MTSGVRERPQLDVTGQEWDEWSSSITHDCEPQDAVLATPGRGRSGRLIGIDAARGVALVGMVTVHIFSASTVDDEVSLAWWVASGTSSALFAVLAGIGLAFMSGRTRPLPPPRGVTLVRLLVRSVVIVLAGLLLGVVVPVDSAGVILPYLGLLFALSLPVLPLRARPLLVLAGRWVVLAPVASHLLRQQVAVPEVTNLTSEDLLQAPGQVLVTLLLTGLYPALTWFAYILLGLGLGRLPLGFRRYAVHLVLAGVVLAVGAVATSRLLLGPLGGLSRLAEGVRDDMSLSRLTEYLVWGGDGTLPADSWWWLATVGPHTGTTPDLVRTAGVALAILGLCLAAGALAPRALRVLAAPGSMTLTLYSAHLLLVLVPLEGLIGVTLTFVVHVVLVVVFGLLWARHVGKGPLEWLVWRLGLLLAPTPGRHRQT